MYEIQPPKRRLNEFRVFLAGSIEMGKASDWQRKILDSEELWGWPIVALNPRRDDWDSSWEQSITCPEFNAQVTWELDMLDRADLIVLYLEPGTMSPISLLELGLHADSRKLVVCCPEGFWRKGNVDIVCQRHGIKQVETIDEIIEYIKEKKRTGDGYAS